MLRGTIRPAALALACLLTPAWAQAQNFMAGPPAATFGPMAGGAGCASCAPSLATTMGNKCCHTCCPKYHHCSEGPVHIHWHHGCPKPVCNPCDLPHWGYWQKCWSPWPWPPDWSHCPTPPPAAHVLLNPATHYLPGAVPYGNGNGQRPMPQEEEAPVPRQGNGRPGF